MTGGRFDPLLRQRDPFGFVRSAGYELVSLGEKVKRFSTGFAAGREEQGDETGIIQIRPTNITSDRDFTFQRNVFIAASQLEKRPVDVLVRGEVLFNNTNSQEQVGKTVVFDLDGDYFCSNHITRISVNRDELDANYLFYLLNLYQRRKAFFRTCVNWNNQSGVGTDVLIGVPIPLPEMSRQREIVRELEKVRSQAQKMKAQANQELAAAKHAIERMLLEATEATTQAETKPLAAT